MATAAQILGGLRRLFEGTRLRPYLCPAGVPTIGEGSTRYEDGRAVTLADPPITAERAAALGARDGVACLRAACVMSPNLRTLENAPRRAAMADFIYNLGPGRYRISTLRRRVNEGNWPEAKRELGKWIWGGGRRLPGLIRRRAAEARLLG